MTAASRRMMTALAASAAAGLTVLSVTFGGSASAATEPNPHDRGGPVVYLNRHGGTTECVVDVEGFRNDGSSLQLLYREVLRRFSCDGTLWLPPQATELHIRWSSYIYIGEDVITIPKVNDNEAICLLAKADAIVDYTNRSPKGGDCNGD